MKLLDLLNSKSVEDQSKFAAACGTTVGYLRLIAYGNRRCGESLAINIDRESGGAVSIEELRPDVDWSYLSARATKQHGSTHA